MSKILAAIAAFVRSLLRGGGHAPGAAVQATNRARAAVRAELTAAAAEHRVRIDPQMLMYMVTPDGYLAHALGRSALPVRSWREAAEQFPPLYPDSNPQEIPRVTSGHWTFSPTHGQIWVVDCAGVDTVPREVVRSTRLDTSVPQCWKDLTLYR